MNFKLYLNFTFLGLFFLTFSYCNSGTADGVKTEPSSKIGKTVKLKKGMKKDVAPALEVGDIAPDFELKGVDGKMMSLADYKDAKGYIITFTCNHCPYAVMYEDRLIELHDAMALKGYPVIAINPNDPEAKPEDGFEEMIVRAKEKGFTFDYLFDDGQKVYPQYGATKTPHVFLLDKDRKVRYIGAIDDSARDAKAVKKKYVEMAIEALEKGEDPNPAFTKAIGCSIKKKA